MKAFIVSFFFIAVAVSFWSAKKAREKLMKELVTTQQSGNEDRFVQLVGSLQSRMYFNKETRIIMRLNYYLLYKEAEKIKSVTQELITCGSYNRNFVIELLRVYTYYLESGDLQAANSVENVLEKICSGQDYPSVQDEIKTLHRLYISRDPVLLTEMEQKLQQVESPDMQMILLYRLAKLSELLGRKSLANQYFNELSTISKIAIKKI